MPEHYQADWIFNFALRLAVIVGLGTLAIGLIMGADPLVALMRSSVAFVAFIIFGWTASLLWQAPTAAQSDDMAQEEANDRSPETSTDRLEPVNG